MQHSTFTEQLSTIRQSLSLPKSELPPLNNQQKGQLQKRWEGCKYIILDEKSMVGRRLLSKMDAWLRDAFPEKQNEMFGGCSILLLGDFGQLPPVGDLPLFNLYASDCGKPEAIMASNKGRALYMSLTENITLDRIMRQQGEDPAAVQFRQVLSNLQSMEATVNFSTLATSVIYRRQRLQDSMMQCISVPQTRKSTKSMSQK